MSICPEHEYRDSLSDEEFWDYIYNKDIKDEDNKFESDLDANRDDADTCRECGSTGACAFDSEGRPMIHTIEDNEND